MAHTIIETDGRFELREFSGVMLGETITGFVAWDTVAGESVGPGLVDTIETARMLVECGQSSVRLEELRLARRLNRR